MTQPGDHRGSGAEARRASPDRRIGGVTPQKTSLGNPTPPPFAFWKGAAIGTVVVVPAVAGAVWTLGRLGIGNPDAGFIHVLRLTMVFAGLAAVLTAGGVGRLAAQASVEKGAGWRVRPGSARGPTPWPAPGC